MGYDVEFVNPIKERFLCPLCEKVLQDPVQTQCGHRFCLSCIKLTLTKPNAKYPLDDEPLTNGAFKDVCCRQEIDSLFCYCLNKVHGCNWEKELMYLKDHLKDCEYQEVPCPNGCEEKVSKIKLNHHKNEVCKFKHVQYGPESHLEGPLAASFCDQNSDQEPPLDLEERNNQDTIASHDGSKDLSTTETGHPGDSVLNLEQVQESASAAYGKNNDVSAQFEEFRSALVQQELKLSELETLSRASLSSTLAGGPRSLSGGSVSLERRLGRNEHQLALHDIQLAEHDLKIQMLEATSYDGTYIWKIDEFSRRQHDAIIGKTPSLYSPPFYVGRYGYKACARVYPNGDGMGKGTHLSLFFVIMRGEYDALLPWPFRQKVTFKLLDHDRQNDVTDTFRPDPNSSSFKRPTSSMNIASGCPIFVTLQDLQKRAYVHGDTLFIKVMVDTAGLPSFD